AGTTASFPDADYEAAGCHLADRAAALGQDVVTTVQGVPEADLAHLKQGNLVIGLLRPLDDTAAMERYAQAGTTALAMELVPRITRAQKMDALSAMSTVAGYKAVLLAADVLPKFFPLLTTAAGTVRPAKVLILGAGVAGLQALATARRLGAVTAAYDVRPAAREQVESVGASFIELELDTADSEDKRGYAKALSEDQQARQIDLLGEHIAEYDIVITTALIPGRAAPLLITKQGVEGMRPGSVIVDLAAANGGNCALTQADETVKHDGATILGPTNLAAGMPLHASQMYARTVSALLLDYLPDPEASPEQTGFRLDLDDEVLQSAIVTHDGAIVNERVKGLLTPAS
ncbi:MAG: NAD(P) transhydrogenase subunit alpha, partial [Rhodothermaceae bacterium]|nr:NAD(P) transhydrogenase subunit alpha [Rhodothermaceae bacterium]